MNKYLSTVGRSLAHLNWFEATLMVSIIALSVISFVVKGEFGANNFIACLSAVFGVFCVVLGAKGSMANWIFGVVECFLYTYIAISSHIYGDAMQRLLYTLPMQFVGWWMWSKRKRDDETTQIVTRYMTWMTRASYVVVVAILVLALGFFLKFAGPHLTDFFTYMKFHVQPNYASEFQLWLDATTTILFFITMFLSVKAYVEQWYLWLFINILSILIWVQSSSDFTLMTVAK